MNDDKPGRVVAIVGRPNVGKSALFNRIVGRRLAIVHSESGVTRDRLICEARWQGQRFSLIDTGGLAMMDGARADHEIAEAARRQVKVAIEDSAAVILATDIQAGLHPLDLEVQRLLRQSGRPVFVAANKADDQRLEAGETDFAGLGFPVHPVSALHFRGFEPLMAAVLAALPPEEPGEAVDPLRVAVVGRPNVGKSSFINRLIGRERVIVSAVPGTTRDSIEIPFSLGKGAEARHYLLVDTAGMRKAARVRTSVEKFSLFRAQRSVERADVVALMLDAVQGPAEQDKKVAALIHENQKGCVLLVNKWDLSKGRVGEKEYREGLRRALFFAAHVPVVFASAKTGYNVRKTLEAIDLVARQVRMQFTTGLINRALHDAFTRISPPSVQGRRLKFYYATQIGVAPVRLQLFVNDPKLCVPAYQAYLHRYLHEHFGLEGAPVVLSFRSSHEAGKAGKPGRES